MIECNIIKSPINHTIFYNHITARIALSVHMFKNKILVMSRSTTIDCFHIIVLFIRTSFGNATSIMDR